MLLSLKVLNEDASLNNFMDIGSARIVRGSDAKLVLQLIQPDRKIRYIPDAGFTATLDLLLSNGTTITKTASTPFADDRSIIQFDLTDTETLTLISQNLLVKMDEGTNRSHAILQAGLQMISTTSNC
jgi:hypothetical protein